MENLNEQSFNILNAKDSVKKILTDEKTKHKPCLLRGASGIGKSDCVKQLWLDEEVNGGLKPTTNSQPKKNEFALITLIGSQIEPQDLYLPRYDSETDTQKYAFTDRLPKDKDSKGILFLDEIGSASPTIQKAFQQLVLAREFNGYVLPENFVILGATNRQEDNAGVGVQNSALMNRFQIFDVEMNTDIWQKWASENGVNPLVQAYFRYEPQNLHNFTKDKRNEQFCSPRSAVTLSDLVYQNHDDLIQLPLYTGCVGFDVAQSFIAFSKVIVNAPSIDDIIEKPMETESIEQNQTNVRFAVVGALLQKLKENSGKKQEKIFSSATKYLSRFENPEFVIFFVKQAINMERGLLVTKTYTDFSLEHTDVNFE